MIKTADWVLDLGPEGGVRDGEIVAQGMPEDVAGEARSYTGQYLRPMPEKVREAAVGELKAEVIEVLDMR